MDQLVDRGYQSDDKYRVLVVKPNGQRYYTKHKSESSAVDCARRHNSRPEVWATYKRSWKHILFPEERDGN